MMNITKYVTIGLVCATACSNLIAAGTVSGVKARQRYPWNGKVDIDCTLSGEAGKSYGLKVSARDKVGGTNLTVTAVSVEGETATGNPVSVTSGVYRLVWDADKDLPNGFRGEKVSISVTVTDQPKKFMIVDLQSGAITYQANVPDGGWDVDECKGTKMAFVRIEPGTFTQYSKDGILGRRVTISKPYYVCVLPVTHRQLRTLSGPSVESKYPIVFEDNVKTFSRDYTYYTTIEPTAYLAQSPYRGWEEGNQYVWTRFGRAVKSGYPLSVLRERTGIAEFDLPTEAQMTFARDSVIWDGYCLCLDMYEPYLVGDATDPIAYGKYNESEYGYGYGQTLNLTSAMENSIVCINQVERRSSVGCTAGTYFCLYEAD